MGGMWPGCQQHWAARPSPCRRRAPWPGLGEVWPPARWKSKPGDRVSGKICWKYGETRGKVNTFGDKYWENIKMRVSLIGFMFSQKKSSATPFSDSYRTRPFHGFSPCFRVKWCETLWLEWQRSKGPPIFKNLQSTAGIEINSEYSIHYNSILAMSLWKWNKNKLQLQYTWVFISESPVFIRLSVSFSRHRTITPMVLWVRPQEFW